MGKLRLKGQEVATTVTGPTGTEEGFQAVLSLDVEFLIDILEEQYLGEIAPRFDEIFKGASGTITVHLEDPQYLAFAQRVLDRAQRRNPGTVQFQVVASFDFPTGERLRIVFKDVKWGNLPISSGSREDYTEGTAEFKTSEATILF